MIPGVNKMFDDLIAAFRDLAKPKLVLALVIDRNGQLHFTVQGARSEIEEIPALLTMMAETINDDLEEEMLH